MTQNRKFLTIHFNENAFGDPIASLTVFRDTITTRTHHAIAVARVPTSLSETQFGFLVVDQSSNHAIFSGDGFSLSKLEVKKHAASKAANFLLDLFDIIAEPFPFTSFEEPLSLIKSLHCQAGLRLASDILTSISAQIPNTKFTVPLYSKPSIFPKPAMTGNPIDTNNLNDLLKDNDDSIPRPF